MDYKFATLPLLQHALNQSSSSKQLPKQKAIRLLAIRKTNNCLKLNTVQASSIKSEDETMGCGLSTGKGREPRRDPEPIPESEDRPNLQPSSSEQPNEAYRQLDILSSPPPFNQIPSPRTPPR